MTRKIAGYVRELFLYPVKSMRGVSVSEVELYWYGVNGDRKYAFTQAGDLSGFPWLTARELPDMLQYEPYFVDPASPLSSAVRIRTPDGRDLPVEAAEVADRLAAESGIRVSLVKLMRGTFDSMPVSVITSATLNKLAQRAGRSLDRRRFRPNIVVDSGPDADEAAWVNCSLVFGEGDGAGQVEVSHETKRCMIVNLDPDSGEANRQILRAVATVRNSHAGVYASVSGPGAIRVGDPVFLEEPK